MGKSGLVVRQSSLDGFGYPLSDRECRVCKNLMHEVAYVDKWFSGSSYGFSGFKCMRCGNELIEHVNGGVLGYGKNDERKKGQRLLGV